LEKHWLRILTIISITVSGVMLFSCKNSIEKVREFIPEDTITSMAAFNVNLLRSDSGRVVVELKAPVVNQYDDREQTIEFPQGFEAHFLNSRQQTVSLITADYGISQDNKTMEARGNVIVDNRENNETMYTEKMLWDQKKKEIYVRTAVKIVAPDKTIYGDSLVANEDFSRHTIYNIHNSRIDIEEQQP